MALRAEHDDLARQLEVRTSIDALRTGLLRTFFGLIAVRALREARLGSLGRPEARGRAEAPRRARRSSSGSRPPSPSSCSLLGIRALLRARRLGADEDRLFARYRELRSKLGLDP